MICRERALAIFRGVSYHVVSARASDDVPPLLPALCLCTLCQDKEWSGHGRSGQSGLSDSAAIADIHGVSYILVGSVFSYVKGPKSS